MKPRIAIIDPNTLSALGLRQLLSSVMPIATVDVFGSFAELQANSADNYVHFFTAMSIVLENKKFFDLNRRKTIVLTLSLDSSTQLQGFHCICVNVPEKQLVHALLTLEQYGHAHGHNLPPQPTPSPLTDRETEVMALIVQGYINKEIADKLSIGLSTVITHRKNIMEKLGVKSVSALTVYAVMNGYVDINKI